jgi:hypothetical protein
MLEKQARHHKEYCIVNKNDKAPIAIHINVSILSNIRKRTVIKKNKKGNVI